MPTDRHLTEEDEMDKDRRFPAAAFVVLLAVGSLPVLAAIDWLAQKGTWGFTVAMALLLGTGVPAAVSFYRWDVAECDAHREPHGRVERWWRRRRRPSG